MFLSVAGIQVEMQKWSTKEGLYRTLKIQRNFCILR